MLNRLKYAAAAAVVLGVASIAHAYQVSPMIYDMTPTGKGASTVIRVNNTNAAPITVELQSEKRLFDAAGKESRTAADGDFVLFPPQAIIPAGATQAVRVQYVGPTTLAQSETYTITVKQVPVKMPADGKSGVQFVFNFSTVANIVPAGAKPVIEVASVEPTAKTLKLTLKNAGNKYANLSTSNVELTGGAFKAVVKDEEWRKALGSSWILPGGTRIVEIPKPDKAPATLSAKFNLVEATQ